MRYLIYDTALNGFPTLLGLQKYYEVNQSLFKGTKDEVIMDVSPWLLQIDDKLEENLSNETDVTMHFTLQLEAEGDIHGVATHLKKFIYQTIDGREYFFRFYDARVLRKYLPTCDEDQLIEFFGPVDRFIVGGDTENEVIQFWQENGVLKKQHMTL